MAERQSHTTRRRQAWVPGVILCGLVLQFAMGAGAQIRRELRLWRPPAATLATRQAEEDLERFVSFVAEHVPSGESALYATPGTGPQEMWAYYRLSYELYPSTVWWVTPVPRSPADPWVSAPLDGSALAALARDKGARYVIADGTGALESLVCSSTWYSSSRALLRLDEGQQR